MASASADSSSTSPSDGPFARQRAELEAAGFQAQARPQSQADFAQEAWVAYVVAPDGHVHLGSTLHDDEYSALREAITTAEGLADA